MAMKAAIVRGPGQTPVYGDFSEPGASEGECLVSVTAAAMSRLAKGRASGTHYSATGGFPFVAGFDGVGRLGDGRRVYFMARVLHYAERSFRRHGGKDRRAGGAMPGAAGRPR